MAENQTGLVSNLIQGVGALIILVIVVLIIVSTLLGANLLRSTATSSTVVNETGYVNATNYVIKAFDNYNRSYAIVSIINSTPDCIVVGADNYTFDSTTGILTRKASVNFPKVNITYTYITPTSYESSSNSLATNLTRGIDNVSGKIPTILLIGAVVLLFGVIVFLVRQSQMMGIGTGRSGSL